MSIKILVVDDEELIRKMLTKALADRYEVYSAGDGLEAIKLAKSLSPDLVLCDINMEGMNGFGVLDALKKELQSAAEIVLMTSYGNLDSVRRAAQGGAVDFISKPFTLERIESLIQSLEEKYFFKPGPAADAGNETDGEIVGSSPAMIELFKQMTRVAGTSLPVTIYGESGTGKELIARTIHRFSACASRPFVALNCGALTETLLESELFGHQRGAFTGAMAAHAGLFEEADGGTVFLDEIGETSPAFQVKLLRVLQEGEIKPVGSSRSVRVNVRVVTASNRDLKQATKEGHFRQDLLYRINAVVLKVPPLRERREDIPRLITRFLGRSAENRNRTVEFTPAALDRLVNYSWPGNVRQLQNTVQGLAAFSTTGVISESDLPAEILGNEAAPSDHSSAAGGMLCTMHEMERQHLLRVLTATRGNKREAARVLGVDRNTVDRMVRTHGIEVRAFKKR
ncbi:MAG TPA: sigma-54 dependent transcriptional regulator [Blastocatellia bacterium]|nr:sigma-54 dependent transcriptional regulator [Blastocatellia bacterium]